MSNYNILGATTVYGGGGGGHCHHRGGGGWWGPSYPAWYAWPIYPVVLDDGDENLFILGSDGAFRTLRLGDSGDDVKTAQTLLLSQGYLTSSALDSDQGGALGAGFGIFGPATMYAVQAYQRAKKLTVDGIIGPKTAASMGLAGAPLPVVSFTDTEAGNVVARKIVITKLQDAQVSLDAAAKAKASAKTPEDVLNANQQMVTAQAKADAVAKDATAPSDVRMTAEQTKAAADKALHASDYPSMQQALAAVDAQNLKIHNLAQPNFLTRRYGPLPGYVWALLGIGTLALGYVLLKGRKSSPQLSLAGI